MPELPEVETVRRALQPILSGRQLETVAILDKRLVQPARPRTIERALAGRSVTELRRRGKYLLIDLDDGTTIEHHLRMTGTFLVRTAGSEAPPHARMHYATARDVVWYCDVRRFGTLVHSNTAKCDARLDAKLGVEPVDPDSVSRALARACARRTAPIKAVLLDQRVIAGLGNIYVDESLHRAGIAPRRPANRISTLRLHRLAEEIVAVIAVAIAAQGSTVSDFRTVDGAYGSMQEQLQVYGRGGEPCTTCGAVLRSAVLGGRTSVWCATCQR